jgi:hypothetical protein
MSNPTTLVLYVFHEYNYRVDYFLKNAVFDDSYTKFLVICNNGDQATRTKLSSVVPSYVETLYRENINYDFGGWTEAIHRNNTYLNYDYFIFTNSSVMGPFISPSSVHGRKRIPWTEIFTSGLTESIKLFGCTIASGIYPSHVQSYLFCMNRSTLAFLITTSIFSNTHIDEPLDESIWKTIASDSPFSYAIYKEINMSQLCLKEGWNIGCMMKYYEGEDFRKEQGSRIRYSDIMFSDNMIDECPIDMIIPYKIVPSNEKYKVKLWSIDELIFIKGNRIFGK